MDLFKLQIILIGFSVFFLDCGTLWGNSQQIFKIYPYVLKNDSGENILKFQVKRRANLLIKAQEGDVAGREYGPGVVSTVNLGRHPCDTIFNYAIYRSDSTKVPVWENALAPMPCSEQEIWTFGFVTDTQFNFLNGHGKMAGAIAKIIRGKNVPFIFNGGDVVHHGGRLQEWTAYFTQGEKYIGSIPQIGVVGNHDYWHDRKVGEMPRNFYHYLRWPSEETMGRLYYSFPRLNLIVINSNLHKLSSQSKKVQWQWLEEKLSQTRQERKKAVVLLHHSPYSSSIGSKSKLGKEIRAGLIPIVENSGAVALVLSGHDHIYERSLKKGVHYIVGGPAGGIPSPPLAKNPYKVVMKPYTNTFILGTVGPQNLEMKVYNQKKKVIDRIKIPIDP